MKLVLAELSEIHKGDVIYVEVFGGKLKKTELTIVPLYDPVYKDYYISCRYWSYSHPCDNIKFPRIYINPLEDVV